VAAPMAESQQAARNPPWSTPTGLVKRSSAGICHTVVPGSDLSTHTMPSVRSQLGGTCTRGSATARRYRTTPVRRPRTPTPAATPTSTTTVRAATVISPVGPVTDAEIVIEDGLIAEVRPATTAVPDVVLVPGFVDLQVNGIGGVDVASAAGEDWAALDDALLAQGVTTWCPTIVTAPYDALESSLAGVAGAARRPPQGRPDIAGAHLEGPFLAVAGAHRPSLLRPEVDLRWLDSLGPLVRVLTLAPELPGALDAIAALSRRGVLVSLGHSACTAEVATEATEAGARLVTHLGNAMGPLHQRAPGLLGAALADDRLSVSVIADLVHTHPVFVRMAFTTKGAHGVALVTDAVAAPRDGGPPRLADGTLAGSVLTMERAVSNVVHHSFVALADAVTAASTTPARLLGLGDRGALVPGRRADLVALEPAGTGNGAWRVATVWVAGARAWPPT
jgi:N-acetylglucosamine-6-phosphate deacetylase